MSGIEFTGVEIAGVVLTVLLLVFWIWRYKTQ